VVPLAVVKLHLLGASGVGKTALRRGLDRTRLQRIFGAAGHGDAPLPQQAPAEPTASTASGSTSSAYGGAAAAGVLAAAAAARSGSGGGACEADLIGGAAFADRFLGRGEGGRRTLGCCVETVALPIAQPPPLFSVWDWGGDALSEALHGLHLLGGSPNALVAVVVRRRQLVCRGREGREGAPLARV
jgi:hypothetical protein